MLDYRGFINAHRGTEARFGLRGSVRFLIAESLCDHCGPLRALRYLFKFKTESSNAKPAEDR